MNEEHLYHDLYKMDYEQLDLLAQKMRKYIMETVYSNNGHLASNFGVVELTLALYRVFNPEEDVVIWDTSHQSYVHKLLTGRWEEFKTLRRMNGISGFTNIHESKYDKFGAGHAGTSISAALGYFIGDKCNDKKRNIISIIGDGAFTCGMALESLNQLKYMNSNVKIILNSNDMSISPNVGSLSTMLSKIRMKKNYKDIKKNMKDMLNDSEIGQDLELVLKRLKDAVKYTIYSEPIGFFEDLGIKYYGPVDGHNIRDLELFLRLLKDHEDGPAVLHVLTTKGKGFENAEKNPDKFHGVSKKTNNQNLSYSKIVGHTLSYIQKENFITFTAAMKDGTGLDILEKTNPNKIIDMGITEPSIVTTAAATSLAGVYPVVDIYSTFMQRAFDSIIHDVALQGIPGLYLLDRAGLVGEDGPTHHGVFDISYLRLIPQIEILTPLNGQDLANMIYTSVKEKPSKPRFIRFPKESTTKTVDEILLNLKNINLNWKYIKTSNNNTYVLAVGTISNTVKKALKDYDLNIIGVRSIKPLDQYVINDLKENADKIIIYEENAEKGGFNEEIYKLLKGKDIYNYGIKDEFITHGSRKELLSLCGLDEQSIKNQIESIMNINNKKVK
ncbi:1-deoxy-D-xylulose-5-phosphate synthase [Oceanotoga sp. DSM 15011]|jgi:1-deoxy-D-xylulose-5-phosphate synthase|nr:MULTISPECIES: 1-deoxy-D-xylulose-5-phosphate synthase [Oceanotoga]MDO7976677.1 1-deoxy-D-xylulose-5-phosphate synthase [Oceanotoga teriensis]UYP00675.1 1-deoxy-D-xylulose-5-phosphate synthase [Oceanotoga sp. DSM 15011]